MSLKKTLKTFGAIAWKNRAKIASAFGIGLVITGTGVIISKARQATDVSYEIEEKYDEIHRKDAVNEWESKKERSKAVRGVLLTAALGYSKTYALGVGCVVTGLGFIVYSDISMSNEITTAWAAAASYAATLGNVKERVIADQGEEKWQEYLLGPQFTTVDVMPDGTIIQTTEPIADRNGDIGLPPHCFFFDEFNCPNNWEKDARMNRDFLESHLRWLNERLWVEGFLFENDIRRDIGAPLVKSGWTSGILAEDKDGNRNYLKFGLDAKNPAAQRFRDGIEPSILIQLNVEDNIIDQLKLALI